MGPKAAVGISNAQIKENFRLWARKNNKEACMKVNDCIQAKTRLLQLSRQNAKILVGLITGNAEVYYLRCKTEKADGPDCRFCRLMDKTTRHMLYDCEGLEITEG